MCVIKILNIDVCHKGVNAMIHDVVQIDKQIINNNDKIRLFREIDRIISMAVSRSWDYTARSHDDLRLMKF